MKSLLKSLRPAIKSLLPRRLLQKARAAAWSMGDLRYGLKTGQWSLPPAYLRVKVCGMIPPDDYLAGGKRHALTLLAAVKSTGDDPAKIAKVLDFGCGCGRVVSAFQSCLPQAHFYGTDAEADLIAWPRRHLKDAEFQVNSVVPPLSYPDHSFDLIYAISVFTHLDEEQQFAWLEELRRTAKPGALLILTVLPLAEESKFEFVKNNAWSDFFPDHYHTAYHGRAYLQENWSRYFTILDYQVQAIGLQDAVVLRRPE